MQIQRRIRWSRLVILFVCTALFAVPGLTVTEAKADAANTIQAAWEKVEARESYRLSGEIKQVTIREPTITNVGKRSREENIRIEGSTDNGRGHNFALVPGTP